MAINLTENVKTYLTYAGIAITSAAVGALVLLAGQGINNWRHPKVLASAITGDMLRVTQGADVEELGERRGLLQRATAGLNQAQTAARGRVTEAQRQLQAAQAAVTGAGDAVTEAHRDAVTVARRNFEAAQTDLAEAQAAIRANSDAIAALDAQIANEGAVNNLINNDAQRDILVSRLNQIPVPPASEEQ